MRIVLRIILTIIGALLALMGAVWILQGVNILPGSFMSGSIRWAIYGIVLLIAGIALLVESNRRCGLAAAQGC